MVLEKRMQLEPSKRVLTAELVETARDLIAAKLAKTNPPNNAQQLSYRAIAKELETKLGIDAETIRTQLNRIFPRERLAKGKTPQNLAKKFLKEHPAWLVPKKLRDAERILTENPDIPINTLARRVGLSGTTINEHLGKQAKLSALERGRRVLLGKGRSTQKKKEYVTVFRIWDVERAAAVLEKHGLDRERTVEELAVHIGYPKARRILSVVFPLYLVNHVGVKGCVKSFKRWRRSKSYKKYLEKHRPADRRKAAIEKAIRLTLLGIEPKLIEDSSVNNKQLFIQVANEILAGQKASDIAEKHEINEKAVIGVRRRLDIYFRSTATTKEHPLWTYIAQTRFYDTFMNDWVSPENRVLVSRSFTITPEGILQPTRPKIEAAFKEAMTAKTELPANVFRRLRIRQPQNARSTIVKPRIIKRKIA